MKGGMFPPTPVAKDAFFKSPGVQGLTPAPIATPKSVPSISPVSAKPKAPRPTGVVSNLPGKNQAIPMGKLPKPGKTSF